MRRCRGGDNRAGGSVIFGEISSCLNRVNRCLAPAPQRLLRVLWVDRGRGAAIGTGTVK
jgi:hypothetical protein